MPSAGQMVYDALNNALIWRETTPVTLHWAYLDRKASLTATLRDIVEDLSGRVGLETPGDLDAAALDDAVIGFVVSDRMSARAALEPLASAYFFDAREEDFKIEMVRRGGAPIAAIPEADLAARPDGATGFVAAIGEERQQELELPRRIDMTFADPALDFQTNTQVFQRTQEAVATRDLKVLRLPLALDAAEAAQRVERIGFETWQGRTPYDLRVSRKYARLGTADVITASAGGVTVTLRVETVDFGADGVLRIRGAADDAAVHTSAAGGVPGLGVPSQAIALAGPSALHLLDIPLLRDAEEGLGIYVAAGALGEEAWPGVSVLKSTDGESFDTPFLFVPSARNATHGVSESVLPDHGARTWDRSSSLTLRLTRGSLTSAGETAVLNGANALLVGDEILQFANAVLNADGTTTIDTLLRGRRGSEGATGSHVLGERVIALGESTLSRVNLPDSDLAVLRFYKGVTLAAWSARAWSGA